MSNYIKVSVPRMNSDGDNIGKDIGAIPQFINELDSAMQSLGSCWEGPAWVAFQQQVQSDIANMMEVYEWMSRFLQALAEAERTYGECEKNSYESINKVRI